MPPSSRTKSATQLAANNNAVWCDTLCRAHGRPGEFLPGVWVNRRAVPRFYPNAVTLAADDAPALRERIQALEQANLPPGWAVKDSFRTLDLTTLGFEVLFEAEWIWRPAEAPAPDAGSASLHWWRVQTAAELATWETAWGSAAGDERLFLPALLADPDVVFLAADQGGAIRAGAIVNQTDGVAGLSNLFGAEGQASVTWAGAVGAARAVFQGLPLVGYEAGPDLAAAQAAGFAAIGPLRVWRKSKNE